MDPRLIGIRLQGDGEPRYQQIFDQVVERIRSGTLPAGFRLPPSRALAQILHVHRNTVVRAYSELQRAGFIECGVGRGTFVLSQTRNELGVEPDQTSSLPWDMLTASAARTQAMRSFGRLARAPVPAGVIRLSGMQPPDELLPHELLGRCIDHVLQTVGSKALGYAPRDGLPRLRVAIAEDLARQGVPASPDDLLVTTGSQQALDVLGRALLDPAHTLLVQQATYTGAIQVFSATGARLVSVRNDSQGPSMSDLDGVSAQARAFYMMPNHCNPTGEEISEQRRRELCRWSRQRNIPLIEDDYAADLVLDDHAAVPAMRALDREVIYVGTYSKKLIPALRIGFIVCPPKLKPHLIGLKHSLDLGSSTLLQYALAEFLGRGYMAAHINTLRRVYRQRRAALVDALHKHLPPEISFRVPRRGLTIWLELPEGVPSEDVFEEATRQKVLVSPGALHCNDGEVAAVRLTFCAEPPDRLSQGAKRLATALTNVLEHRAKERVDRRPAVGIL